jgi:sugar phosphate isomerase/epimerase
MHAHGARAPRQRRDLHVRDRASSGRRINVADPANATPVPLGEGEMDFRPILEAARRHVEYYFYEQDPPFGDPTFDPFASAQVGLEYLDCFRY